MFFMKYSKCKKISMKEIFSYINFIYLMIESFNYTTLGKKLRNDFN